MSLTGKIFKIIPISEEYPHTLHKYIDSLINEIIGAEQLIIEINYNVHFTSILATLKFLSYETEIDHSVIKAEVSKCLTTLNKLQKQYYMKEDD